MVINREDVLLRRLDEFLDDNGILHFSAKELTWVRSLKRRNIPPDSLFVNVLPTLHFLEFLRKKFGPIAIISGYRNEQNNEEVGGAEDSQHLRFGACDHRPISYSPREYGKYLIKYYREKMLFDNDTLKYLIKHKCLAKRDEMGIGGYNKKGYIYFHTDFGFKYRSWGVW